MTIRVFYSSSYVGSSYAFDTTRKSQWIADSLIKSPIHGIELVEPVPLIRATVAAVHDPAYVRAVETGERVYFDLEDLTFADPPLVTRPHTYMLGVATPDGNSRIWTARGQDDEARMWSEFLDWLGDPNDVALYCWTMYERRKMEQAAAAHPQLTSRLQTAATALVDLKEEIKHRPYFPVPSYSIKAVAPVCGFRWSQDDVDGQSAQLMYLEWLRSGDDALIERVRQYNREDVLAMAAVDRVVTAMSENAAD